ncbi:class I adenylate-forming enzyme family protein [Ilumatobacter sp.]|uniref:class I adenylate-forming enzyme family protein n=1 Tax=Ilumatobacter sp. TaxID=1967498 RepID=UPI003AF7A265
MSLPDSASGDQPGTLDDLVRRAVAARPDDEALVDAPNRTTFFHGEPLRLTWAEVDRSVDRLVASLAGLGVRRGDAVAIQLPNVAELVLGILACARMGAIAVPFPIQHRRHELRDGFGAADVVAVLTANRPDRPDHLDDVSDVLTERPGTRLAVFDESENVPPSAHRFAIDHEVADVATTPASPASEPDDVVTICWTSGTTGTPKGVPRTNAMWLASSSFQVERLSITADDRILCPFPVVNMAGIGGMLLPWAMSGGLLVLHQPLDLPVFLQQLAAERVTYTVAPPPLLNMLLRNEELLAATDLSHIRAISSGSAPLDDWMVAGWQERGIEIVNVFGSNEGAALLSTRAEVPDPAERARYFPQPDRPGMSVRLIDLDTGDEIREPGRPGELRFRGPTVFDGYLDSSGEEFDDEGYYRTGDIFELAGEGDPPRLLRFVDRAKDIIIRGGMNVSAAELEAMISRLEGVAECAVVGYPDPDLGERVGVFAVPAGEATPDLEGIVAHLREVDIASYKLPERCEIVDGLPRNAVGKVTKPELRDRWAPPPTITAERHVDGSTS